jgi:hypothetical protein
MLNINAELIYLPEITVIGWQSIHRKCRVNVKSRIKGVGGGQNPFLFVCNTHIVYDQTQLRLVLTTVLHFLL